MIPDDRVEILARALRKKHLEISKFDYNSNQHFTALAQEVIRALDEYYGAARYWMSAEFEREKVLRQLEATIDRIRNADVSL